MDRLTASRRELLLGVGTIGISSIGAGIGTYAALSDSEQNSAIMTAGGLNLRVHHESNYNGESSNIATGGTVDGEPGVLFDLPDVKPGDSGRSRFCFEIETNPAYLWVCGSLQRNAEAGLTEQERKSESSAEYETGELADAIRVKLKYADAAGNASETITKGSLRTVLARLSEGYHSILRGGNITAGSQQVFEPSSDDKSFVEPCLVFEWTIPKSVGNEIQTDRVEFGLTFYAQQARHSDGTENPCNDRDQDSGNDDDRDDTRRKAISFVAFCVDENELPREDVEVSVVETNEDGEPLGVAWESETRIDRVVLKTGGGPLAIENFTGGTTGRAVVGTGTDQLEGQNASTPVRTVPRAENSSLIENGDVRSRMKHLITTVHWDGGNLQI